MRKLTVGILAHVDAGKTTLAEAMLYTAGSVQKLGRVDKRDSFLDNFDQERKRGITIFSKQAILNCGNVRLTLLDTPGHADFSSEMERCLRIMDCAILVISGTDGTQAHTSTVCSLLEKYDIPTFIFVTKMDVSKLEKELILRDLEEHVSPCCMDFSGDIDLESVALLDEKLLENYLEDGEITDKNIAGLVSKRRLIPCFFGSGLKLDGIDTLIECIERFTEEKQYPKEFGARVYKITRDNQDKRMTWMKITGGTLSVRDKIGEEKITQIRIFSGQKYETADTVYPGDVCAVMGLSGTYPGQGLGSEPEGEKAVLEPVLSYRVILPQGADEMSALQKFRELEEEDPQLNVIWNSRLKEIQIHLLGKIQAEILTNTIKDRFGLEVSFDNGRVLYKETIANPVEGIGHYEPLKHYAEVHLKMEPLPRNSGMEYRCNISQDVLDINWQRLIMTHLQEKQHVGVLTGSPLTDMRITVSAGKAHLKHTEGGDFRQATYRAVRQGLMQAESLLLEPVYKFELEVPTENIGRAITDIRGMEGEHDAPFPRGNNMVLRGTAPIAEMSDYASEVLSYTGGRGRLSCRPDGYVPCHNREKIIEQYAYDPCSDLDNTPDSVFCAHGAGFNVPWNEVPDYCHIIPEKEKTPQPEVRQTGTRRATADIDESELEAIMMREFGPIKRKSYSEAVVYKAGDASPSAKPVRRIIVDGYNVIYAWDELQQFAEENVDLARERLLDILANYRAYTDTELVVVFDAYGVKDGRGEKLDESGLHVVYTKEGETADAYIEKLADEIGKNENVKVVSSDAMIQLAALKSGVMRISAKEFKYEVDDTIEKMRKKLD